MVLLINILMTRELIQKYEIRWGIGMTNYTLSVCDSAV